MKEYSLNLNVKDAKKRVTEKLDSCKFESEAPFDKLSYINKPFSRHKLSVTYKYLKSEKNTDEVCTSVKSFSKFRFVPKGDGVTHITVDTVNKRKKISLSDVMNLIVFLVLAVFTFAVFLLVFSEDMMKYIWLIAIAFIVAAVFCAIKTSARQWKEEPAEDPSERIELLTCQLMEKINAREVVRR